MTESSLQMQELFNDEDIFSAENRCLSPGRSKKKQVVQKQIAESKMMSTVITEATESMKKHNENIIKENMDLKEKIKMLADELALKDRQLNEKQAKIKELEEKNLQYKKQFAALLKYSPDEKHLIFQKQLINGFEAKLKQMEDSKHPINEMRDLIETLRHTNATLIVDRLNLKQPYSPKEIIDKVYFSWCSGCWMLNPDASKYTAPFCQFLDKWGISFGAGCNINDIDDYTWLTYFNAMEDQRAFAICSEEISDQFIIIRDVQTNKIYKFIGTSSELIKWKDRNFKELKEKKIDVILCIREQNPIINDLHIRYLSYFNTQKRGHFKLTLFYPQDLKGIFIHGCQITNLNECRHLEMFCFNNYDVTDFKYEENELRTILQNTPNVKIVRYGE